MTEDKKTIKAKTTRTAPKRTSRTSEEKDIVERVEAIAVEATPDIKVHKPTSHWLKIGGGALLLLLVIWLLFSRGNEMIAGPIIKAQLSKIAENISSQAALSGDEATLTYGDVFVEGGIFNKKAIIKDLRLDYKVQLPFGNVQKTTLQTTMAHVTADQINSNTINITFPEPFMLEREGYQPLALTFEGKPIYRFKFDGDMEQHKLDLPNKIVLGVDGETENPVAVVVRYAESPSFIRDINRVTSENKNQIAIHNISLTSNAESNEIRVGGFSMQSSEITSKPGSRTFDSKVTIDDVEIQQLDKVKGPYDLTADVHGNYQITTDEAGIAGVTHVNMDVKNLKLATSDYQVSVVGAFSRVPQDPMLFGNGEVAITGFDKLRHSELIPVQDEKLKDLVIATVTGNADPNSSDVNFTVKREQNGTFFIGKTTFENLIGVMVTHVLSQQKALDGAVPLEAPDVHSEPSGPATATPAPALETASPVEPTAKDAPQPE